jgi:hypothetical protein
MIVMRLVLRRRDLRDAVGPLSSPNRLHKAIITILIKHCALYAVSPISNIGLWCTTNPLQYPSDVTPSIADGEGDWDGERATGLDAQQEDSVFLKSYIPRTLNEVYDPERDLEELKKGAKTIYSNTIGIVDLKPEATSRRAEENVLPDGEEKPKVHFSAGLEMEDETQDPGEGEEEGGEEEDGEEEREDENEPRENKPRGHRHEDKEAKKVIRNASFITLEWLTTRALGMQEGRQGGATREAQSQDVQVREEEKDTDHHQQTMRWNSFAFSSPASGIPMLPRNQSPSVCLLPNPCPGSRSYSFLIYYCLLSHFLDLPQLWDVVV